MVTVQATSSAIAYYFPAVLPDAARKIGVLLRMLPRAKYLVVSVAYERDTPFSYFPIPSDRFMEAYDPLQSLAAVFDPPPDASCEPLELSALALQLELPACDLDLLWYHDWDALDATTHLHNRSGLRIAVALCVTKCPAPLHFGNDFRQFVKRVLPRAAALGCVSTTYSGGCAETDSSFGLIRAEAPSRASAPGFDADGVDCGRLLDKDSRRFVQFAENHFAGPGDAGVLGGDLSVLSCLQRQQRGCQ